MTEMEFMVMAFPQGAAELEEQYKETTAKAMAEQRQRQIRDYAASVRSLSKALGVSPDAVLKGMSLDDSTAEEVRRCLEEDGTTAD